MRSPPSSGRRGQLLECGILTLGALLGLDEPALLAVLEVRHEPSRLLALLLRGIEAPLAPVLRVDDTVLKRPQPRRRAARKTDQDAGSNEHDDNGGDDTPEAAHVR